MPVTITGGMTMVGGAQFTPPPPPVTYTALENISSGDPVAILGDNVRIAKSIASSATKATLQTKTNGANGNNVFTRHPSSGKLISIYGVSDTIRYRVGTPSGSSVTWATEATLYTDPGSNNITVWNLNNQGWNGNDTMLSLNISDHKFAKITFNSSTDTLTIATPFAISASGPATSIVYDSANSVWAWVRGLNSNSYNLYLTQENGTTNEVSNIFPRNTRHSIWNSPNGGFIVAGRELAEDNGSPRSKVKADLVNISSNSAASVTASATFDCYRPGQTDPNVESGYDIDVIFDTSGNALCVWKILTNSYTAADNRSTQGNFLTITSNSVSAGSTFTAVANQTGSSSGTHETIGGYFSGGKYYVYQMDPNRDFGVSSFTNSSGSPGGQSTTTTGESAPNASTGNFGGVVFETSGGLAVFAMGKLSSEDIFTSTYFPATDYRSSLSGVAVSTVTTGNDTEVTIQGQTATSVTGLSNGTTYYVTGGGSITTTNTGFQIGTGNANGNLVVDISV